MGSAILSDEFISLYSKKIMGFAYTKTLNIWDAEDLAQETLMALLNALKNRTDIRDMDGFVYTVCCHTWSNFFRANKKRMKNDIDLEYASNIVNDDSLEENLIRQEDMEKMRKEVSYLSYLHRKITILFYYEDKKGEEIAKIMNIPHSTIRWHLSVIRKKLKEGFEMENKNISLTPQNLGVGHNGWTKNWSMNGLNNDLLVQNIAIACYGESLTVEEISRKMGVAAAYLENHINNLVYMDYLKIIDGNKYQTNFFISEKKHSDFRKQYLLDNVEKIAVKLYKAFEKRSDDIISIGFCGSDLDKNFIEWAVLPVLADKINWSLPNQRDVQTPMRKDGSAHWVSASMVSQSKEEDTSILAKAFGVGNKTRGSANNIRSRQLDISVTKVGWREFNGNDLDDLKAIKNVIEKGDEPNESEKLLISKMINMGYVAMVDSKPKIMIPFLTVKEHEKFQEILSDIVKELGDNFATEFVVNFSKGFDALIPDFIDKDEREMLKGTIWPIYAIMIFLAETDYIKYPKDDEEAKRLCTFVWEV